MSDVADITIPRALDHWSRATPSALALTDGEREFTYAELAQEVDLSARRMLAVNVAGKDRVIIVGNNSWQWVVAYLAALRVGAIAVPMNNRLSAAQVSELLEITEPQLILSDDAHAGLFSNTPGQTPYGLGAEIGRGDLWDVQPKADALADYPAEDAPAIISFTSGTTGIPKGAVLDQLALAKGAEVILRQVGLESGDSTLVVAPLFHNIGFNDQLGQMILCGGRTDLLTRYRTKDAVAAFRARPVTFITAVPSVLRLLMTSGDADAVYGPARTVIFGGSPMPGAWSSELLRRWPQLQLWHGYGLTEFTSCCSLLPPKWIETHGESIGFAPPDVRLRLVGEDGTDVANGEVGEIWVAGRTRMTGYWGRPDATAEKIAGEWLMTGDLGRMGEHGLLYHVGRKDDVINRGGEKILPSYVESVLSERPDIAQCTVFGAPHSVLQNVVVAAVETREGHVFDPNAALGHLSQRLPGYAVPEEIVIFDPLPRTASGKVDRRATRTAYLAERGNSVDAN